MRTITVIAFLMILSIGTKASRVDTLMIKSETMGKVIPTLVILPDAYAVQDKGFPTLYLLHGAYDNYLAWLNKVPQLKEYVDTYNFIIVCPDGGHTSWYFDSVIDDTMQYETYVSVELMISFTMQTKECTKN